MINSSETAPLAGFSAETEFPAVGAEFPAVELRGLHKTFAGKAGFFAKKPVWAVRGIGLALFRGKTLGLVGESGCGKSTVGRMAVGLLPPTSGEVLIGKTPLYVPGRRGTGLAEAKLSGQLQMVFQDPFSSLNPRMRVGESVGEPLRYATTGEGVPGRARREKAVAEMFELVGLDPDHARRYPHEFSGGQRQRIAIARALITDPVFVVCDEPTSSLDASVQAQVLNMLKDMQARLDLAYLFISHDLAVVRHMSEVTAVMYAGLIMEQADSGSLFAKPAHPYTRLLLASVPGSPDELGRAEDDAPSQAALLSADVAGCPFAARCPEARDICARDLPDFYDISGAGEPAHLVRCHLTARGVASP